MKNNLISSFVKLVLILLISTNVFSDGDLSDSVLEETLDSVLKDEYKPCSGQSDFDFIEINTISSFMILSGNATFNEGDEIISSSNARAIISSFDKDINKLRYYQNAKTGFKSFLIDDKINGTYKGTSFIKEFVYDFVVPCSELIVSLEESPQQMLFIFTESDAAIQAKIAAHEMMAEIEFEMALEAFQQKLADEKAAAAKSNAAYQSKLENDAKVAALMEELALEQEIAAFEAQLKAELAAQEMMAEIIAEEERAKRLAEFQAKLEAEKAAAAASTAAYQAKVAYDARIDKILQDLVVKLEEVIMPDDYKSILVEELIEEATAKLEAEKFIGAISGEIVTVAIHEFCKDNLNLSDSNIELFKKALAGGYLGNVGPQIDAGTEFTANRWDKYITCVGSEGN